MAFGESRLLIDGKLVEASNGAKFDNINPATEEVIGVTADATVDDAAAAAVGARRAFEESSWATDPAFRARCLRQVQVAMRENQQEFVDALTAEAGSPALLASFIQFTLPVDWLDYWATMAETYPYERQLPVSEVFGAKHRGVEMREPVGVVTAITPFNYPIFVNLGKVGPALAAGNAVILKPSPETPWCATIMGRVVAEQTDIPPGIFSVVASSRVDTAEALVKHPDVDMVSFTGSTVVGRRIMEACSERAKKCLLELGGKSANIILDDLADADLERAVAMGGGWVCTHSGQGCAMYTRLLLPRSRYEGWVDIVKTYFEGAQERVGDPAQAGVLQGPQISARQRDKVLSMIDEGKRDGARLLVGGGVPPHLSRGYYVQPTLFVDVEPDAMVAQEEFFGPVLVVIPYDDEEDAVRIANNSIYGLSGSVWSADEERALRVARRIRTGTVAINNSQWLDKGRSFGGYKQSGVGREFGVQGFEEYMETKVVSLPGG
jgi:aldehyde dehydrogenase (NAD+)